MSKLLKVTLEYDDKTATCEGEQADVWAKVQKDLAVEIQIQMS